MMHWQRRAAAQMCEAADVGGGDELRRTGFERRHLGAQQPRCQLGLQHALRAAGVVEPLLTAAGFTLTPVTDGGRCCGSAGTYSVLQPELATRLLRAKVAVLEAGAPQLIATANVGCLAHLRTGTTLPVHHWIELLAARLSGG